MLPVSVRQATLEDTALVSHILSEVAAWLEERNMALWGEEELAIDVIKQDVSAGLFYIAFCGDAAAGVFLFQMEDVLFWGDVPHQDSVFIHRLAVRRSFAGSGISSAILQWAVDRSRKLGKRYVRLDCIADRPALRSLYERFGFQYHSDRQVGPHHVARYEYEV